MPNSEICSFYYFDIALQTSEREMLSLKTSKKSKIPSWCRRMLELWVVDAYECFDESSDEKMLKILHSIEKASL